MTNKELGDLGETLAAAHLKKRNYKILEKKYKTRTGEIDIIAKMKGTLVFVEVKTRRSLAYGTPAQAVDTRKQHKLIQAARQYLNETRMYEEDCRFDVIEIYFSDHARYQIRQIESAFDLSSV